MILKVTGAVMAIFAIALLYMGAQLVAAGGSAAYSIIALAVLASSVLLMLKKQSALTVYALLMWGILIWIVVEVGFDKWQWIPRGDLFALLGLWLALPWVVRPLYKAQKPGRYPPLPSVSGWHRRRDDPDRAGGDVLRPVPGGRQDRRPTGDAQHGRSR